MAYSYNEVTGTGSPLLIAVPEYIDQSHIFVRVGGVETLDYEWVNDQTVRVTAPVGVPIRVFRRSSPEARVVDYLDGVALTEDVLDNDSKQAFFLAQEQLDATDEAVVAIGSLPAALSAIAAETTASRQNMLASEAARDAAAAEADAAEASRLALEAAGAAQVSAATTQANNAATSATQASGHKDAAAASASAAAGSATAAANSATTASGHKDAAAASATQAANSATAAANSATNAANSASAAANSATQAAGYALGLQRVYQPALTRDNVNGKVMVTTVGVTLPANVFQDGDIFAIENVGSGSITISPGSGMSLANSANGAAGGARTLSIGGLAIIRYTSGVYAYISGPGVS